MQRPRTNTPLQALTLMNDEAYVEMTLAFAERILREAPEARGPETKIQFAFKAALARNPRPVEMRYIKTLLLKRHAFYKKNPRAAAELIDNAKTGSPQREPTPANWQRGSTWQIFY